MENEDSDKNDVIQEDEEKQMKQNLDIESLYDTLEGESAFESKQDVRATR